MHDEALLELSRLEREVWDRVRRRAAAQQLGEAWKGIEDATRNDQTTHHGQRRPVA
jgi:hypothetical protein